MTNDPHPLDQTELMAYLDGELPPDRAAWVGQRIAQCQECRITIAESRDLAERLSGWQVEPAPLQLTQRVAAATEVGDLKPQAAPAPNAARLKPGLLGLPRWAWAAAAATCALLIVVTAIHFTGSRQQRGVEYGRLANMASYPGVPLPPAAASLSRGSVMVHSGSANDTRNADYEGLLAPSPSERSQGLSGGGADTGPPANIPMIVRTASLTLVAKDFEQTRAALEGVVRRHRGYSGQLTVGTEDGSARTLSATYRVPADQLDATIAEIKQLARVEKESQSGEEVTDQYVDLQARLSNARRTEQTLLDVLEKRAGKLSDVLEVEEEQARVREQIERMDAEMKNLKNRVSFSTLQVELHEEYKAEIGIAPSLGRRLENALVEGFRTAADSLASLALLLLNIGPVLLLWALILFWPARYAWRRLRAPKAHK